MQNERMIFNLNRLCTHWKAKGTKRPLVFMVRYPYFEEHF